MTVEQYDVFFVDFSTGIGSEQEGIRPAVIIQSNKGCAVSPTVIACPLTKNLKKLGQPTHNLIRKSAANGLRFDSVVLGECARQIDKSRLISKIGVIDSDVEKKATFDSFVANITGRRGNVIMSAAL